MSADFYYLWQARTAKQHSLWDSSFRALRAPINMPNTPGFTSLCPPHSPICSCLKVRPSFSSTQHSHGGKCVLAGLELHLLPLAQGLYILERASHVLGSPFSPVHYSRQKLSRFPWLSLQLQGTFRWRYFLQVVFLTEGRRWVQGKDFSFLQGMNFSNTYIIQTIPFYSTWSCALQRHHIPHRQECTPAVQKGNKMGYTDRADARKQNNKQIKPKKTHTRFYQRSCTETPKIISSSQKSHPEPLDDILSSLNDSLVTPCLSFLSYTITRLNLIYQY